MSNVYSYHNYDKHLCLRVGIGLWFIILYLLRPYIILASSVSMGRRGFSGAKGIEGFKEMVYPDQLSILLAILATVPVLLFIFAWTRRRPSASGFVRYIWRNGVLLLIAAAVLNIVIVFVPLFLGEIRKIHMSGLLQIVISAFVIGYLKFSERVKDTFSDFPEEEVSGKT